jgi:hypothetical protein
VADLASDAGRASAAELESARTALARLPCPSVAFGAALGSPAAAALVDHFDVVLTDEAELAPVLSTVRRTPLAATALAQLLRHNAGLGAHEGLIAESLVYSTLQSGPEFGAWQAGRPPPPALAEEFEPAVLVKRTGDRLDLTLNRPRKHNAFSAEMRDGLVEGLRIAVGDTSIAEVVVRGAGPSFSSGGDLDEFGTLPDPATAHAIRSTRNAARLLADCANRTRFEIQGACVGAGAELPAFARRVVAAKDAYFQLPEVSMGLVPGAGGTVSIPRRIGRQRTARMALSGLRIDAETAWRWGLVDELRT